MRASLLAPARCFAVADFFPSLSLGAGGLRPLRVVRRSAMRTALSDRHGVSTD